MINISFSELNLPVIIPAISTLCGALAILLIDIILPAFYRGIYIALSFLILLLSLCLLFWTPFESAFFDLMLFDRYSLYSQVIILGSALAFLLLCSSKEKEFECAEYFSLFLFMISSYQFMTQSSNLAVIFIALEASSLALYALIALKNDAKALEAALKYFTLGAIGSGFFAFGIVFLYASFGSIDMLEIIFNEESIANSSHFISLGFIFLIAALGFKLSFFPFHSWVSDIYEGSNPPLAFYMSIATKIAAFVVFLRLFGFNELQNARYILFIIIILTTTIPNLIALKQTDIVRMLGYSSISQAGFALACVFCAQNNGDKILFLYWFLFLWANLGVFGILWLFYKKDTINPPSFSYSKFSGLVKSHPLIATALGIFMLSLAGIPPFGLFWGKLFIILSAMSAEYYALALILLINSALAVYYYLKLIVFMFLKDGEKIEIQNSSYGIILAIICAGIGSVGAICYIGFFNIF